MSKFLVNWFNRATESNTSARPPPQARHTFADKLELGRIAYAKAEAEIQAKRGNTNEQQQGTIPALSSGTQADPNSAMADQREIF